MALRILLAGVLIAAGLGVALWLHGYKSSTSERDTDNCVAHNTLGGVERRGSLPYLQDLQTLEPSRIVTITCGTTRTRTHPSWADPVALAIAVLVVAGGAALIVSGLSRGEREVPPENVKP